MKIPASVMSQKPTQFGAVEVRHINGYYYVYLVSSRWDAGKGRPRKGAGKSVRKITEADGFIPNANGMRLMQEMRVAYETLLQLSPGISDQLRCQFPDVFSEIRTVALLRLVDGVTSAKMVQPLFMDSCMSGICAALSVSEGSVRRFVVRLGSMQDRQEDFMRASVMPGTTLLFNGTAIFSRSPDSLATKGYNPEHNQNPQARLLYVFEKDSHRPVFYRVVQGSIVDKSAFMDTVAASGCRDCVIIADKGFYSKRNVSALLEAGMRYILPLQDNTANVEPGFYEDGDDSKWDGVFTYKRRAIWFRKRESGNRGNSIYTFRDDPRRAEMAGGFVERAGKGYGEEGRKPEDVIKETRLGYFSFCSNLGLTAKEIYLSYKER